MQKLQISLGSGRLKADYLACMQLEEEIKFSKICSNVLLESVKYWSMQSMLQSV